MPASPKSVLFLCTGNSARSLLAECLLERLGRGAFRAYSAGSKPKSAPHPQTLALLRELGYAKGYRYPHDAPSHFVREQYLPDALVGTRFYQPSDQGAEAAIAARQRARWSESEDGSGER